MKASILDRKNDDTYSVRFDPSLNLVMQEAKYLDRLGFTVPDAALNIALQEDKYHALVEGLKEMLDTYHSALNSVGLAERQVLLRNIRHLQDVLSPGLNSLNWNSLGIHAFIERCKRVCGCNIIELYRREREREVMRSSFCYRSICS